MSERSAIEVRNARTHNLKGVDCRIPHGKVTVVTGPSGAGKSSLAFDTVYAEGQRRFVESMSTYARQFLEQMERPEVDAVDNVLPAVALEAKNSVKNARSTVGTITEAMDVLRLLYTHLGEVVCPEGHGAVRPEAIEEVVDRLVGGEVGERFTVVARVKRPPRQAKEALGELIRQGFARRLDGDEVVRLEPGATWPKALDPLPLALGRFRADGDAAARIASTLEEGLDLGAGQVEVRGETGHRFVSRGLACATCGTAVRRPVPALFSFNSPLGACSECQGFGRVIGIDRDRVIPDPSRSLIEHPIAPWNTPAYDDLYDNLFAACRERGVPLDVPWEELTEETREWIWRGEGGAKRKRRSRRSKGALCLDDFFAWLERRSYRVHVRVLLARYRAYNPCPACHGARLQPEALAVQVAGLALPELCSWSIERLEGWLRDREWSDRQKAVAGHLIEQLEERVGVLARVGLGYLTLDRQARTLSGGETQRIHLAAALGSGLTSTLYVLDEPTIGLHPQDSDRLLALLRDLTARGNTALVVEHDRTLILGADHLIDLGPMAGEGGGELMAEGPVAEVLASPDSLTGKYLQDRPATRAREHVARFRREKGWQSLEAELEGRHRVAIRGARANNLQGIDVELPMGTLVAVTGVSGSGKSTLIENVLHGTYQRSKGVVDVEPGEVDELIGLDAVADVTLVDQRPIGRSTRSNPVTYVKAYDEIRRILATEPRAKEAGIAPGHFSFNVDRGRCAECKGTGVTEVDMQFMAPVSVVCERCQGNRFRPEVLEVRHQGKNVAEILDLTVEEARTFFAGQKKLLKRLGLLADVGLGYLRLGQATSTLSGGEAQRLKLASFLDRPASEGPRLFLFDEPTTGLHLADIDLLAGTLRRLVQRGDGVVVVEHSSDLIARADWIVDLGPGGGVHGGELLYSGPLAPFLDGVDSPTAREMRRHLSWPEPSSGGEQGPAEAVVP